MGHDLIRLDDLLARDVSVQWFEGVALVQALCRQLLASSGADGMFPRVSQITLASDGTVAIGGAVATSAVPAAGHLLARLLSDDVPVRFRLLVTQATAQDGASGSLLEFSESLAYFERPDSEGILRALYARGAAAPLARRRDAEAAEPVAESTPRASIAEPRARKPRRAVVAAAIVFLAVIGLFVGAGLRNGRLASVVEHLESAIAPPAEAAVESGNDEATTGPGAPEITAADTVTTRGPRPSAVPEVSAGAVTLPPFELESPNGAAEAVLVDVLPANASDLIEATSVGRDKVYSRSDASVTPPRQVYPALPARPSPGRRREDLTVVDLVVTANGQVEHVRLRTAPRDVHEFMLVSAAKAWQFEPATLHGRPVRFLLSMAITSHD